RLHFHQILQLIHELFHILEIQIYRRESHVGDLVVFPEPIHDQLAQLAGLALTLRRLDHERFRLVHDLLQFADRYRTLFAGAEQSVKNFLPVEFLAAPVFFNHHVGNFVDALVGREALAALQTLAPPPDRFRFLALARVHYLVIGKSAKGTFHGAVFSAIRFLKIVTVGERWKRPPAPRQWQSKHLGKEGAERAPGAPETKRRSHPLRCERQFFPMPSW